MHFTEEKKAGHIELAAAWPAAEGNCQSSPLPCDVIMSVVLLWGLSVRPTLRTFVQTHVVYFPLPRFLLLGLQFQMVAEIFMAF